MSDYISKQSVKDIVWNGISTDTEADKEYVCGLIDSIPSADVRENIHGEWVNSDIPESILSKCSVCGFQLGAFTFNFCPKCGADMREPKGEKGN